MARMRASKKGDVSSAAESAAATSPPPAATPRRSRQINNETPSPKQANQRINKKEATANKKKTRSTKKEERDLEMRQ
eukprot:4189816-Ditylum_brightwellii.AAC.1